MRWEELFDDLAAQWDALLRREADAEVADRTRRERAAIGLYERLCAAGSEPITVMLCTGAALRGRPVDVGDGWLLLAPAAGPMALVPFGAVTGVAGLGSRAAGSPSGRRFGLGYALRGLSRDRSAVTLTDVGGGAVTGTIDGVGRDILELSEHAADLPRRPEHVTGRRLVPFAAVAMVCSA